MPRIEGDGVNGRNKYPNPQTLRFLTVSPLYLRIPHSWLQPTMDLEPANAKG